MKCAGRLHGVLIELLFSYRASLLQLKTKRNAAGDFSSPRLSLKLRVGIKMINLRMFCNQLLSYFRVQDDVRGKVDLTSPVAMDQVNVSQVMSCFSTLRISARTPKPHVRLLSLVYDIYVTLLLYDLLRNTPVSALLQHCLALCDAMSTRGDVL